MPNPNLALTEAGTYSIDAVIKGQSKTAFYDSLAQVAYQPEVRRGKDGNIAAVMPYEESGIEGLFAQLQAKIGGGEKKVKARKFYWAEFDQLRSFGFSVSKSTQAIPAPGVGVTVDISRASLSANGNFAKPLQGYKAYVKENNQQNVTITNVVSLGNGLIRVTLQPIGGQVLDLTKRGNYTIVMTGMKTFDINNDAKITGGGMVGNPPALRESFVQKYDDSILVNESEIDNYVYDKNFFISKGLDASGKPIEYFYIPQVSKELETRITVNRTLKTLFNERDYQLDTEFDGLIPTIRKYGMFNMVYDSYLGGSMKALLTSMIKSIRKANGSSEYFLIHDFNFGMDWNEAMAQIIEGTKQYHTYSLFGTGGEGMRDFDYYNFGNFSYGNYHFLKYQMDVFDSNRYNRILENFAALMPAKKFMDTDGNPVPILNYVNVGGAEAASSRKIWHYDFREQGEKYMQVFAKDSFGIEIHKPSHLGMLWSGRNTN